MTLRLPSWPSRGFVVAAAIATITACSTPAEQPPSSTSQPPAHAAAKPEIVSPAPAPEGTVAPAASPSVPATPTAEPDRSVKPAANADALASPSPAIPPVAAAPEPEPPVVREVTVPAGTMLPVELKTTVGSEASRVEDPIRGTIRHTVSVKGVEVIPAGSVVTGHVTDAKRSAKVKGLAHVAFRFTSLDLPGEGERLRIQTAGITREAQATKKKDVAKIGGGAAGGAIIGGILGGGSGAAKGAAIGGAAGTGAVLATRGNEVSVPAGTDLSIRLTEPITVRVRR